MSKMSSHYFSRERIPPPEICSLCSRVITLGNFVHFEREAFYEDSIEKGIYCGKCNGKHL